MERDIIRVCNDFPFNRWTVIGLMLRFVGPKDERKKLNELRSYLDEIFDIHWEMRNLPLRERKATERVHLLAKWTRFNDAFVDGVARNNDPKALTEQVERACRDATYRKAWFAFIRSCVEVAWLASLFVFDAKKARQLGQARKLLDSDEFEESYQLSTQVHRQMNFSFTKAVIEKAVVYVGATILGIFAYQTNVSIFVAIILFITAFTVLPYVAFRKLIYP